MVQFFTTPDWFSSKKTKKAHPQYQRLLSQNENPSGSFFFPED